MSFFTLEKSCGEARAGRIKTFHGEIQTPIFMPVGTRASVKAIRPSDLLEMGAEIILGNTYHLYLRPGHDLIERVSGGLHEFMNWERPILTDSGGFQVFSLSKLNKLSEEGVEFRSHIDGSKHLLTPEKSMEIQKALGSDIVMCFDECPELPANYDRIAKSMELSVRWAKRCKEVELKKHQFLFGIIQGGLDIELRKTCLEKLREINFDGYSIGGLSVGEKNEEMLDLLEAFVPQMDQDKPRYLMGVGKPLDILNGIKRGIDMFDCVLPTRNARNGQIFTTHGPLNIKNQRFKEDKLPLDPYLEMPFTSKFSRAYVRHLFTAGEYLAHQILSYHNLYFFLEMTRNIRKSILEDKFDEYYEQFYKNYSSNMWKD